MTGALFTHRAVAVVFCLTVLLSIIIHAQSGSARPQAQPTDLTGAPSIAADNLTNHKLTSIANDTARPANPMADTAHKTEPSMRVKVSPWHPRLELNIAPSESKLNALAFAEPDEECEHAPRSFRATAYSLRGRTASGVYVRRGVIAADPRVLPLGSVVQVRAGDYSGVYTVHDTGLLVKGRAVDIWMPSSREARSFGRRQVKLQVLRYGPRKMQTAKAPPQQIQTQR